MNICLLFRILLLCLVFLLGIAREAPAQTLVPSTATRDAANRVKVSFATTPGKNYRVERTRDLKNWTFYPGAVYGLGQTADYYVYEGDPPPSAPALPSSSGPEASESHLFLSLLSVMAQR